MENITDLISKLIYPALTIIISLVSFYKLWGLTHDRLFDSREKHSKFVYELYKVTEDEDLKRLSIEYGYAAITKESFLTLEQRKALIKCENPIRDIEMFIRCKDLLNIYTDKLSFAWKKGRYSKKWYYVLSISIRVFLYMVGCIVFTLPLVYHDLIPTFFMSKIINLPKVAIVGIVIYCFCIGFFIAWLNMSSAVKIMNASKLIKRHPA